MRCSRWSEDLAGVAVLELHDLVVDLDVADSRWRSLTCGDVPVGRLCGNRTFFLLAGVVNLDHARTYFKRWYLNAI